MKLTLALATIAVWLTATPATAWGHMPPHSKPPTKMTPRAEYRYANVTVWHAKAAIRFWRPISQRYRTFRLFGDIAGYHQASLNGEALHARLELRGHRWLLRYGRQLRAQAWRRLHPTPAIPHRSAWLCIHRYEGSWTDAGAPYWGGLQMDRGFMRTYGSDMERRFGGLANVWPVWAQMEAAERAYSGYDWQGRYVGARGYHPWPNTARYCGLL